MKDDIGLYPNLSEVKWKVKLGDVDVSRVAPPLRVRLIKASYVLFYCILV